MTLRRDQRLLLVTNRAPATFARRDGALRISRGAGGVVTALRDVVRAVPITWVAVASSADDLHAARRQRERGGMLGSGRLALRLAPLPPDLYADYYGAFASRVLWFAQHGLWSRRIDPEDAERVRSLAGRYACANAAVADAVAREMHRPGHTATAFVHDYHLYLVPRVLRERIPGALISHFLHIPWPRLERWREALPLAVVELLARGLLASDVIGFQDAASRRAFSETIEALVREAHADEDEVRAGDRIVLLRVRPVSIDPGDLRPRAEHLSQLRADPRLTVVRVDRADPIKNVPAGFEAFERLLARRPDLVGRVRFLARVVPSRATLPEYARERERARAAARRVNARFPGAVELVERSDRGRALAELAAADAVLVNSLADGMNLVAKEAAIVNRRLALVLSRNAGAYAELGGAALGVDPANVEETSRALERALEMPEDERRRRAAMAGAAVRSWTARRWLDAELADLAEAEEMRRSRALAS